MVARKGLPALLAAAIGLAPVAASPDAAQVGGTASYRERVALPVDAVFEATLEDVSRADAPATVLGRARIEHPGQPPIRFHIAYDPARIDARHSYTVRGRVTLDGELLFTTDRSYPVLTRGAGRNVALTLIRVRGGPSQWEGLIGRLPADFTGTLPCRRCAGIRYHLRLLRGDAFHLATTEMRAGQDVATYDIGSWSVSSDSQILVLRGGREASWRFAIQSRDTLRALSSEGREVPSQPEYELRRDDHAASFEPRVLMRGMYRYMADAGVFTECSTGQRLSVAQEADNAALEQAYVKSRRHPGDEVIASVEGRIARRPRMEGNGDEAALIVERFVGIRPGETCGARGVTSDLEGTRWRPTQLGGEPVLVSGRQREPWLVLEGRGQRVIGFTGCNRMSGSFERNGERIRFGPISSTRMACLSRSEIEQEFLRALESARTWRVLGTFLELQGDEGSMVARFEARDL